MSTLATLPTPTAAPMSAPAGAPAADRPRTPAGGQGRQSFAQCLQRSAEAQPVPGSPEAGLADDAAAPPASGADAAQAPPAQTLGPTGGPEPEDEEAQGAAPPPDWPAQAMALGGPAWPHAATTGSASEGAADRAMVSTLRLPGARRDAALAAQRELGGVEAREAQRPGPHDSEQATAGLAGGPGAMAAWDEAKAGALDPALTRLMAPAPAAAGPSGETPWLPPGWPPLAATPPAAAPAHPGAVQVYNIAAAPHTPEFPAALAHQVSYLLREGVQEARLDLNPAELGPVHVHIAVAGQQAQVDFAAAVSSTRAALEASLPALASALQAAGLTLTGGGVSQEQAPGSGQQRPARAAAASDRASERSQGITPAPAVAQRAGRLDLYA